MKRRSITAAIGGLITGGLAFAGFGRGRAIASSLQEGMGGGMMGSGGMDDMMSHNNMMGPMKLGMELFERHAQIQRATE